MGIHFVFILCKYFRSIQDRLTFEIHIVVMHASACQLLSAGLIDIFGVGTCRQQLGITFGVKSVCLHYK